MNDTKELAYTLGVNRPWWPSCLRSSVISLNWCMARLMSQVQIQLEAWTNLCYSTVTVERISCYLVGRTNEWVVYYSDHHLNTGTIQIITRIMDLTGHLNSRQEKVSYSNVSAIQIPNFLVNISEALKFHIWCWEYEF